MKDQPNPSEPIPESESIASQLRFSRMQAYFVARGLRFNMNLAEWRERRERRRQVIGEDGWVEADGTEEDPSV